MIFWSFFSTIICTVIGYVYPAWATFKVIENTIPGDSSDSPQHAHWLVYWIMIALFTIFEMCLEGLVSWLPFYYEAKIAFLAWLALPQFRGATKLYHLYIAPTLEKYESHIDHHIEQVRVRASSKFGEVASDGLDFVKSKGVEMLAMAQDAAAARNRKREGGSSNNQGDNL